MENSLLVFMLLNLQLLGVCCLQVENHPLCEMFEARSWVSPVGWMGRRIRTVPTVQLVYAKNRHQLSCLKP